MPNKSRFHLDDQPITLSQYATILICFLMNTFDGMDVLVISYTAPAIANDWNLSPEALGIVFSSGLLGMTIGTLFLAPFADRIGRKTMMLICAALMGSCIYLTSYATNINLLIMYRFLSGLGIGSMLASTASLTAEYTPNKTRDFWVSFVIAGYPVGAVLSGFVAAQIIPTAGWEQMFRFAGIASLTALPLIYLFLSESVDYYLKNQPANALDKINRILQRMKKDVITELPPVPAIGKGIPVKQLLSAEYKKPSIQLWFALFMAFSSLYFLTSWIPKLANSAGLSMELAIYAGTVFNLGAFVGILTQGAFSSKYGSKRTIGVFFILTAILMCSFGLFVGSDILLAVFGLLGFGIQGGFVGLYAVAARMYPTEFRTTGVGWAMGAGRLGGIIGPAVGGVLIGMGLTLGANFLVFAIPTAIAGLITMKLSSKKIR